MKKVLPLLSFFFVFNNCIPLRVAPEIKDYRIVKKGKRFKKGLPKKTLFIFEDPKEANAFYDYVNTKFNLEDYYVDVQVPFFAEGQQFYFSFYEVEITDKTLNLFPVLFDLAVNLAVGAEEMEPLISDDSETVLRKGNYYICLEVFSDSEEDCLSEDSLSGPFVLSYLRALKKEYLSTDNYNELVFKN